MIIDIHKKSANHYIYKGHDFYYGSEGFKYSKETPPSITREVYRAFLNVTQEPEDIILNAIYQVKGFYVTIISLYNTMRIIETKIKPCNDTELKKMSIHNKNDMPFILGFIQSMNLSILWHAMNVLSDTNCSDEEFISVAKLLPLDDEAVEERLNQLSMEQINELFQYCIAYHFNFFNA